jgi:hypothetical protein
MERQTRMTCMRMCVSVVCRTSSLPRGQRATVEGGDGEREVPVPHAREKGCGLPVAWCLTRPPRLQVWGDVRMGRDPAGAVKRRCAGREREWTRQRMWHHARHEHQFPYRKMHYCAERGPSEVQRRASGHGVAVVAEWTRVVGSDGHVTNLVVSLQHQVVTDQEVACRRTKSRHRCSEQPWKQWRHEWCKSGSRSRRNRNNRRPGRNTLEETAGR